MARAESNHRPKDFQLEAQISSLNKSVISKRLPTQIQSQSMENQRRPKAAGTQLQHTASKDARDAQPLLFVAFQSAIAESAPTCP